MPLDFWVRVFGYFVVYFKLLQFSSVGVVHEVEPVGAWSFESATQYCITFSVFEDEMEINLGFLFFRLWTRFLDFGFWPDEELVSWIDAIIIVKRKLSFDYWC